MKLRRNRFEPCGVGLVVGKALLGSLLGRDGEESRVCGSVGVRLERGKWWEEGHEYLLLAFIVPCPLLLSYFSSASTLSLVGGVAVLLSDQSWMGMGCEVCPGQWFAVWGVLLFHLFSHQGSITVQAFTGTYGVNYGRVADNIPGPESVVTILKAAKIKNVRIFDADHSVLNAFNGSGLEISVMVPNELLKDMSLSEDRAINWIKDNVQPFLPDTLIRGIAIGNEILGGANQEMQEVLPGAVKNVYSALTRLQLADLIEVSTPHSEAVFVNSYPPSSCLFKDSLFQYMKPLLDLFSQTGAPFYINAYPFLAYMSDPEHIDINYALFKKNPGIYDAKTKLHYDNMFDAQIDAAYAALEAAGYGRMEVRISETGWASKGGENEAAATMENARTYNYNLRKRLSKKKGTPLRPKIPVRAYVFALFNENLKPGPVSERNFGLFKADGSISYDIGFTGLSSSATSSRLTTGVLSWAGHYNLVLVSCAALIFLMLEA